MIRESDLLMEKMLWVSGRLRRVQRATRAEVADPASLLEAQGHFYAAQSSQARARRVPQGFLFQQARAEVYRHLLRAERTLDGVERLEAAAGARGRIRLASKDLTLLLDPHRGGRIVELSDKLAARSLLDVQAGPVPAGRQAALVDRLLPEGTGLESFLREDAREAPGFSGGRYEGRVKRSGRSVQAVLSRAGGRSRCRAPGTSFAHPPFGGYPGSVAVGCAKTVELSGRTVRVRQRLVARSACRQSFLFATEINLGLKDAHVNRIGEAAGIRRFAVVDPAARLQVSWKLGRPARLWHFPLESGSGLDRVYQGVRLAWVWPVRFGPSRRSWEVRWEMTIGAPHGALQA